MELKSVIWILIAFVSYLIGMIYIGAKYSKTTKSTEDFFLGGRGLNGWVAALSAQASDMSGWLLMGLPGAIYAYGIGEAWIAIGLFIGTVINWVCIASRLRRYTIVANNSLTLPAYFENRFHDDKKILLTVSSVFIVIFFLVYTASAFASGGKLINVVFGVDYRIALTVGAAVILIYTFLGGFMAVCLTDFFQGLIMLAGLFLVPVIAYLSIAPGELTNLLNQSEVLGGAGSFLNIAEDAGSRISAVTIISNLAWGLGYCGMPHILTRFMAVSSEKELNKSKAIGIVWVFISLFMACFVGVVGRAYLMPTILGEGGSGTVENVFIQIILKLFTSQYSLPFIAGIFLSGVLAAIMSTADSQLLVTASAASEDIYKGVINTKASDEKVLNLSRLTVVLVAVIAYVIALNPNSSIMGLVSNAWAGFGATFGPVVVLSLFWNRSNREGAIAGMVCGGLTVILWDYIPLVSGQTLAAVTGLYSLVVGFAMGLIAMVVVSLATPKPNAKMLEEFEKAKEEIN